MSFLSGASLAFDIYARDHASDNFRRIGSTASTAGTQVGGFGSKLKKFGVVAAKAGAIAAAAAGVLAVKYGVDAVKAAAEDQAAQLKLATALKNVAGAHRGQIASVERWIDATQRATGVADDDLRPALQRLVVSTGSVSKGQAQLKLAMDVSAGTGKSLQTVTEALQKANNGSVGGLARLGVATKDATGKTKSLAQITDDLAKKYAGQSSKAAETFEGRMARIKIALNENKEALGAKLLPALTRFSGWILDKGLPAMSDLWQTLKSKLGPIFARVAGWVRDDLWPALQNLWSSVRQGTDDALPALKSAWENIKPVLRKFGDILVSYILPALGWLARNVLPKVADGIAVSTEAWRLFGQAARWMWNNALQPVLKFLVNAIGTVLTWLGKLFGALASIPGAPKWIKDTANALKNAGDQADQFADSIRKIPTQKNVNIHTTYTYSGLRAPGGPGPTRSTGGDSDIPGPATSPRTAPRKAGRTMTAGRMTLGDGSTTDQLLGQAVDLLAAILAKTEGSAGQIAYQRTGRL